MKNSDDDHTNKGIKGVVEVIIIIGINNARDYGEGALRIEFYSEEKKLEAAELLKRYNYVLSR